MDDFPLSVVQTNLTDQWKFKYSVDTLLRAAVCRIVTRAGEPKGFLLNHM
jgi:hypothetical protein